ncbi:NADH dehydrogenase-like protein [Dinothrombium tinctorium]|uniref:NADH dehydrogenase [ubiquinone] 1 beta subcomplex subunit 10 n=1 Tax=Dinothrombium tinctorium TaxID=1965070 RepID=A0A3S3NR29_9ACAR|nr:NADH dehydrogenase-like protein [Dinothrombium tinctorium]
MDENNHSQNESIEPYREEFFGPPLESRMQTQMIKFVSKLVALFDVPATWFREKIVEPNRKKDFVYYHQKFRRVPTIDECYTDDMACIWEANEQFNRDRKVDANILRILRTRYMECLFYHGLTQGEKCEPLRKDYKEAELNWFIKYGDLGPVCSVIDAYMKQKHRMILERRKQNQQNEKKNNE